MALSELAATTKTTRSPRRCSRSACAWCWCGVALSVFQQLVGINTVLYYGPEIFATMGYHMDAAFLGIVVACIVNLLSTMVVVLIVDKVGRKPLLIFGGLIMGLSMLMLGSLFHSQNTGTAGAGGDLPVPRGFRACRSARSCGSC